MLATDRNLDGGGLLPVGLKVRVEASFGVEASIDDVEVSDLFRLRFLERGPRPVMGVSSTMADGYPRCAELMVFVIYRGITGELSMSVVG